MLFIHILIINYNFYNILPIILTIQSLVLNEFII